MYRIWISLPRIISDNFPLGMMMRVPGGTSLLTLFGGADSAHLSNSLPSSAKNRETTHMVDDTEGLIVVM